MKNILLAALLLTAFAANADDIWPEKSRSAFTVTPHVSTLGAGIQIGDYQLGDSIKLRANIQGVGANKHLDNGNITYNAKMHLFTAGVVGDYYFKPESGFYASAGLYYNDNSVTGTGMYNGNVSVNTPMGPMSVNPSTLGNITYKAEFAKTAPYLGLGYRTASRDGLHFSVDVGVLYQGDATMTYDIPQGYSALAKFNPALNATVENNKIYLQDQANKLRLYPVVSVGLGYRF